MNKGFFGSLAVEARIMDVKTARAVYFGLCRMILRDVITKNRIVLPNFGSFSIKKHSARNVRNIHTGEIQRARDSTTIKFNPSINLRKYIDTKMGTGKDL